MIDIDIGVETIQGDCRRKKSPMKYNEEWEKENLEVREDDKEVGRSFVVSMLHGSRMFSCSKEKLSWLAHKVFIVFHIHLFPSTFVSSRHGEHEEWINFSYSY